MSYSIRTAAATAPGTTTIINDSCTSGCFLCRVQHVGPTAGSSSNSTTRKRGLPCGGVATGHDGCNENLNLRQAKDAPFPIEHRTAEPQPQQRARQTHLTNRSPCNTQSTGNEMLSSLVYAHGSSSSPSAASAPASPPWFSFPSSLSSPPALLFARPSEALCAWK